MDSQSLKQLEKDLWSAADNLRANSDLKSSEYSTPVLGLIFLKFADNIYKKYESEINKKFQASKGERTEKPIHEIALETCGFYLPDKARYDYLLNLPEKEDIAKCLKEAMVLIEEYKPELQGVLPHDEYFRLTRKDNSTAKQLLKTFSNIPDDVTGDVFGQIYEYFLGEFAMAEGQGGGEFFTPRSVVRLMVEILEPSRGTVFDPACGSGGMFVQSAHFIEEHRQELGNEGTRDLFVYGQEKNSETVKLAKMNLAVNGLRGEIKQGITYYEDHFDSFEKFDYVMANPPFNVDDVNLSRVEKDKRFNTYGIPRNKSKNSKEKGNETVPNANYLWINLFATSLKPSGRAALVMANSASDARHSEADIRKTLIEKNLIYGMLTLPSNMFYTVTLPATLWFFDKAKTDEKVLFIDARNIFTQIDRAHREFNDEQIQNISIISKLHRGKRDKFTALVHKYFVEGMQRLKDNKQNAQCVVEDMKNLINTSESAEKLDKLKLHWKEFDNLGSDCQNYLKQYGAGKNINEQNQLQHSLSARFSPFFINLHDDLKQLDKLFRQYEKENKINRESKELKETLGKLHQEVKEAESLFKNIHWLQERFPEAKYQDVTGLCKLASLEEIKEQDYSLNPGRYVGVVIEEDGKTEEEFIEEIVGLNDELEKLNAEARELEKTISLNIKALVGET